MGLFNDNVYPKRLEWEYEYTGRDLLPKAMSLLTRHTAKEMEARNKTAELLRDASVSQNDSRFNELKKDINTHGSLKEQLEVFVRQFTLEPDRKFTLGLGDVTFFELTSK
jgi:hypothetical protein